MVITYENDYLAHHGVKGQKWGVRRYQNADGSLTAAGREHYGYGKRAGSAGKVKYGEGHSYDKKQLAKSTAASVAGSFVGGGIGSSLARTAYARHVAKKQMENEGYSRDNSGSADAYNNNLAYRRELNRRTLQYLGDKKFDTAGDVVPNASATGSSLATINAGVKTAKSNILKQLAADKAWVANANSIHGPNAFTVNEAYYEKALSMVATQGRQAAGAAIVGGLLGAAANIGLDALTTYATKRILSNKVEKQAYQLDQMKNNKSNKTEYGKNKKNSKTQYGQADRDDGQVHIYMWNGNTPVTLNYKQAQQAKAAGMNMERASADYESQFWKDYAAKYASKKK